MKTLKLSATGDIEIIGGKLQMVSGADYIRQKIETRLKFWQGEWFLDRRLGFPWLQRVLGRRDPPVDPLVRSAILSIIDVVSVQSLTINFDNRTRAYSLSYAVVSTDGTVVSGGIPFIVAG